MIWMELFGNQYYQTKSNSGKGVIREQLEIRVNFRESKGLGHKEKLLGWNRLGINLGSDKGVIKEWNGSIGS